MGTTADKLNHLLATKDEIRAALISRGQSVPDGTPFSEYPDKIRAISGGGGVTLGQLPEGSIIFLNENTQPIPFYVAKHNYEPQLNGEGRTLLVRKEGRSSSQWNTNATNDYNFSYIRSFANAFYLGYLDTAIQQKIETTKFYYISTRNSNEIEIIDNAVFILSDEELGIKDGNALPISSYLKICTYEGSNVTQWTRTPDTSTTNMAIVCSNTGSSSSKMVITTSSFFRPCFTLPSDYVIY